MPGPLEVSWPISMRERSTAAAHPFGMAVSRWIGDGLNGRRALARFGVDELDRVPSWLEANAEMAE
jgi:hypothetical protein